MYKLIKLAFIQDVLVRQAVQVQTFQYLEMMETTGKLDLKDQKVLQEVQGRKEYQAFPEIQDLRVPKC